VWLSVHYVVLTPSSAPRALRKPDADGLTQRGGLDASPATNGEHPDAHASPESRQVARCATTRCASLQDTRGHSSIRRPYSSQWPRSGTGPREQSAGPAHDAHDLDSHEAGDRPTSTTSNQGMAPIARASVGRIVQASPTPMRRHRACAIVMWSTARSPRRPRRAGSATPLPVRHRQSRTRSPSSGPRPPAGPIAGKREPPPERVDRHDPGIRQTATPSHHQVSRASAARMGLHPMRWTENAITAIPRLPRTSFMTRVTSRCTKFCGTGPAALRSVGSFEVGVTGARHRPILATSKPPVAPGLTFHFGSNVGRRRTPQPDADHGCLV
jgi:hypothetical protein